MSSSSSPVLYVDEKTPYPAKKYVRSCHREKMLLTRNCRRKIIKNLFPEKRKRNM